jgi:integral membrane sensor domain MASE1
VYPEDRWRPASLWLRAGLLLVAYFLAAELGYALSVYSSFPTLWPPAGLLLAALLLSDTRDWPLLIAVGMVGSISSDLLHGRVLIVAIGLAAASGVEGLAGALLVHRFAGARPSLQTVRQVLWFVVFGALLAPAIGASLGTVVNLNAELPAGPLWGLWVMWWISDATAVVVIAPPILTGIARWHDIRAPGRRGRRRQAARLATSAAITALFAGVSWLIFTSESGASPYKFVLFAGILAVGAISGPFAGAGATLVITLSGIAGMASASPAAEIVSTAEALTVIQAQGFFVVVGVTSLALSAALLQNKRMATDAIAGQQRLERMVQRITATMGKVVELRDPYTQGHQIGVSVLCGLIAVEMGMSEEAVDAVQIAALVHDVGKLSVPAEILTKPGKLSEVEFALIKEHSQSGYDILKEVDFGWPLADVVLQHHERMDGSGYPNGLAGDDILMAARVVALADVVEAMASHRPYRPALGLDAAVAEIKGHAEAYDPQVSAAFMRLHEAGRIDF